MSKNKIKKTRINEGIVAEEVLLISSLGESIGTFPLKKALKMAKSEGLDLVEVSPEDAEVHVCKMTDYGKHKFEQTKKQKESKKKQKITKLKEVRLQPKIGDHDFGFKFKNIVSFLQDRDKVKVTVRFRGREMIHTEFGRMLLNKVLKQIEEAGEIECGIEDGPRLEGKTMSMVIFPKNLKIKNNNKIGNENVKSKDED